LTYLLRNNYTNTVYLLRDKFMIFFGLRNISWYIILLMLSSCTKLSEAEKQRLLMATLAAENEAEEPSATATELPSKLLPAHVEKGARGFCGDGVINGEEYCDGNTISDPNCETMHAYSGQIACDNNCMLDIRNCLTQAADKHIGGRAETCKCNCSGNNCDGGCSIRGIAVGVSRCQHRCEQTCVCNCGELLTAHIERCDFECDCTIDPSGSPQCLCSQNQCDLVVVTKPNIAAIAAQKLRSPL
jgi:hypothetical protein